MRLSRVKYNMYYTQLVANESVALKCNDPKCRALRVCDVKRAYTQRDVTWRVYLYVSFDRYSIIVYNTHTSLLRRFTSIIGYTASGSQFNILLLF